MPFSKEIPQPFTRAVVEALAPAEMGVYGLLNGGKWIYIGSGDIRKRLLDHVDGDTPCIAAERPTRWVYLVTPNYVSEEKILILAYNPVCNRR